MQLWILRSLKAEWFRLLGMLRETLRPIATMPVQIKLFILFIAVFDEMTHFM